MRFRLALLATAMAVILSAGISCAENIVVVNGVPITRTDFTKGLENGIGLSENFMAGRQVLDALIGMQLVKEDLKAKGITVSEEEVEYALAMTKKSINASGGSYEKLLQQTGASDADVKQQLELNLALRKLMVSEADLAKYLKENVKPAEGQEQVKYYSMAFMTKEAAAAASKEAREGKKEFAVIAKEYGAIQTGAPPTQLLTATKGVASMELPGITAPDPNFLKQLFAAPAGQVSEPLSIKLAVPLETSEPGKTERKSLGSGQREFWIVAKVVAHEPIYSQAERDSNRDKLFQQKASAGEVSRYINELKTKAKITVSDPRYKSLAEDYKTLAAAPAAKPPVVAPSAPKETPAPAPK